MRSFVTIKLLRSIDQLPEYAAKYEAELALRKAKEALPPGQQLAMMMLLRSDLSRLIVKKLLSSTVRVAVADFEALVRLRLAQRKPAGTGHLLSPIGRLKAHTLSYDLAQQFEIPVPYRSAVTWVRRQRPNAGAMTEAGNA